MAADGYEDARWWDTPAALAWQRGEGTAEGARWDYRVWRRRFIEDPAMLEERYRAGRLPETIYRSWQARVKMTEAEFEAYLVQKWPGGPRREPETWQDASLNDPSQPVVGISYFEAQAYCNWLAAQTDLPFRLPSEAEWEAAARGQSGRRFAYGDQFDPLKCNWAEAHIRRTTPVGVFPEGDTPEGVADMTGNTSDWTLSLYGPLGKEPQFTYPYNATDGREYPDAAANTTRIARGGCWTVTNRDQLTTMLRRPSLQDFRGKDVGMRLAVGSR
jgi:formylglycine-generating enzyme required for sulfatase activity